MKQETCGGVGTLLGPCGEARIGHGCLGELGPGEQLEDPVVAEPGAPGREVRAQAQGGRSQAKEGETRGLTD